MKLLLVIMLLVWVRSAAQHPDSIPSGTDSLSVQLFERGTRNVNKCTPWHHLQCIYITGTEVYIDGREGKSTRHWWRMSYIGRACKDQHGTAFGKIFEGFFVIPHYIGVGLGNGIGYVVYLLRGTPDELQARKRMRGERRLLKEAERKKVKSDSN